MDRSERRQRWVRTAWTGAVAALVVGFILVPALDAVGALLLAPKMHAVAVRVFAGVLWAALVGAAWSYQPSSHA